MMFVLPKRRWLRYSIRTLLVAVTIFCVWLGWQVSIVRERERLAEHLRSEGAEVLTATQYNSSWMNHWFIKHKAENDLTAIRRLLGDEPMAVILLKTEPSKAEQEHIDAVFPEANSDFLGSGHKARQKWDTPTRYKLVDETGREPQHEDKLSKLSPTRPATRRKSSDETAQQPQQSQ